MLNLPFPRIATIALLSVVSCSPVPGPEVTPGDPAANFDRSVPPPVGSPRATRLPVAQLRTLSNGLRVVVVEQHTVPLVTLRAIIHAGPTVESSTSAGLAHFTAALLPQGTASRTAAEIAAEMDRTASRLTSSALADAAYVEFTGPTRSLASGVDVLADVLLNPAFDAEAVERIRGQVLTMLAQRSQRANLAVDDEFNRQVYGPDHPYGRPPLGSEPSVRALTVGDLRAFHSMYYRPNNVDLLVVGDVAPQTLFPLLEDAFNGWIPSDIPEAELPELPPPSAPHIVLVDRPGAVQSQIRVGHIAVPRGDPNYPAMRVVNNVLGGPWAESRLMQNLRADKAYTYGVSSAFSLRRSGGVFSAYSAVETRFTKESVVELMKELEDITASRPPGDEEVATARARLIHQQPLQLETQSQLLTWIEEAVINGMPLEQLNLLSDRVARVTAQDAARIARAYIKPNNAVIVVVGDRARIEEGLRQLPYPVEVVVSQN